MPVRNAYGLKGSRQRVGVELRIGAGARNRAHIDDQLDSDLLQQCDELDNRVRRMADCVELVTELSASS